MILDVGFLVSNYLKKERRGEADVLYTELLG